MAIEEKLRHFVMENFLFTDDDDALADEDSFLSKGIVDSTGIMEVILFVEEEFGIRVLDDEMVPENLDSIVNLAGFVRRKTAP